MKMTFGKYKGKELEGIPVPYLLWLWEQPWLKRPLREQLVKILERKGKTVELSQQPSFLSDWQQQADQHLRSIVARI